MVKRAMVMSFMTKVLAIHVAQSHLVRKHIVRFNEPIRRLIKFPVRIMMAMRTMVSTDEEFSVMIPQLNRTSKTRPHDRSEGCGRHHWTGHRCSHWHLHRLARHWTRSIGSSLLLVHWARTRRRRIHPSRWRGTITHLRRGTITHLRRGRGVHGLGRRSGVGCCLRHHWWWGRISNWRRHSGHNHRCRPWGGSDYCCSNGSTY